MIIALFFIIGSLAITTILHTVMELYFKTYKNFTHISKLYTYIAIGIVPSLLIYDNNKVMYSIVLFLAVELGSHLIIDIIFMNNKRCKNISIIHYICNIFIQLVFGIIFLY